MPKKRKKSPKSLNLFGIELNYSDYVKRFLPENKMYCEKVYGNFGFEPLETKLYWLIRLDALPVLTAIF